MRYLFILLFYVPTLLSAQSKQQLTKLYEKAISDFIKAANSKNKMPFDTLFFGKHNSGEGDHFPDIQIQPIIEKTQIRIISPEQGEKNQKERPSRIYINLFGWFNKDMVEFFFVVFSNGFAHQYDYKIYYNYNREKKTFELDKIKFIEQPFTK